MQEIWPHKLIRHRETFSRLKIVVNFSKLVPSNKFLKIYLESPSLRGLSRPSAKEFPFLSILHRARWATSRDSQRKFLVLISTSKIKKSKRSLQYKKFIYQNGSNSSFLSSSHAHSAWLNSKFLLRGPRSDRERAASPLSGIWTHPMRKKGSARDEILISGRESRKKNFPFFFFSTLRASPCAYFSLLWMDGSHWTSNFRVHSRKTSLLLDKLFFCFSFLPSCVRLCESGWENLWKLVERVQHERERKSSREKLTERKSSHSDAPRACSQFSAIFGGDFPPSSGSSRTCVWVRERGFLTFPSLPKMLLFCVCVWERKAKWWKIGKNL